MMLSEMIKINNRFEKSVNLLLDLNNQSKIKYYIPTRSSINILTDYLSSVKEGKGENATILIGPYGKGKSHLLLVLLAILAKNKTPELEELIAKIELLDKNASKIIKDVLTNKKPYLPVIVNAGTSNLNQALLRSLMQALKRDGLSDISPSNHFTEAVNTISSWKTQYPATYKSFINTIKQNGLSEKSYINSLSLGDNEALQLFKRLYPELTSGGTFNPLIEDDIIEVYRSVNHLLCEKKNYAGIYIIFDEFSKYIEGHSIEGFSADMKVLQDMCELSALTNDEKLFITMVAHKNIKSYGKSLPKEIINAFKGVEGRITEKYFTVSSQNNYELISNAIIKNTGFKKWCSSNESFKKTSNDSYSLHVFKSLFNDKDFYEIVAMGCFPLSPISALLLLSLAEKIAQNERTVFTFLADKSSSGLNGFLKHATEITYANCDLLYDYFVPLFKEESQELIHNEWLKADYALSKTEDQNAKKIIKSLAIVRMINHPNDLAADSNVLELASGLHGRDYSNAIELLTSLDLITYRERSCSYEFKNNIGIDINEVIKNNIATETDTINIASILSKVIHDSCILPKKHNQDNCITRYFNIKFMDENAFLSMNSTEYLEWENTPDGEIILVLPKEKLKSKALINHSAELNDNCLILSLPSAKESCEEKATYYYVISKLINNEHFISDNLVLKKELEIMAEDLEYELNLWIQNVYFLDPSFYICGKKEPLGIFGLNRLVSETCDKAYGKTPRINNENINRNNISAQYLKARNNVLLDILQGNDFEKYASGTSAESTIGRSVLYAARDNTQIQYINKKITDFIKKAEGKKITFSKLYNILTKKPIGMRKGAIPIYIANCLVQLDDMPVIYFNDKEMPLSVETLNNINASPEKYSLFVEKETIQKEKYITSLEKLFEDFTNHCRDIDKRNRLSKLACMMQSWYRSLPQSTKTFCKSDYTGQPIEYIRAFRRLFVDIYLNPRELLFEKIPNSLGTSDYVETASSVSIIKKEIEKHIHLTKDVATSHIRCCFGFNESDLVLNLSAWIKRNVESNKKSIYSTRTQEFINIVRSLDTTDNEEIVNLISKSILGIYVEDWNDDSLDDFIKCLGSVREEIETKGLSPNTKAQVMSIIGSDGQEDRFVCDYDPNNPSSTGVFFRNALDEMLEEYGDTIEVEEKVGILLDTISKMLK